MADSHSEVPPVVMPQCDAFPLLKGQTALVTGGDSGIGRGVALALAQAGADVVVNYAVNAEAARQTVEAIRAFGVRADAHQADVSNEEQVAGMFQKMISEFGTLHILVNNAGWQKDAPFDQMTLTQWNQVLSVNLAGQFLCAREAAKEFKRRGVVKAISCAAGKIICMSSVHEVIPWAGHANYAASKGGIQMLMKTMAQELAPFRIRVNSIAPGAIKTPINQSVWGNPEGLAKLLELIPYGRIGEVEDIGRAAVWLASDQSDYVHGTSLYIDGGMTLYPDFATGG